MKKIPRFITKFIRKYFISHINIKWFWFGANGNGLIDNTKRIKRASIVANYLGLDLFVPTGTFVIKGWEIKFEKLKGKRCNEMNWWGNFKEE